MGPALADIQAAKQGDKRAAERVVRSVEGLCRWFAKRQQGRLPSGFSLEDANQECRVAVLYAIRRYNPRRARFPTYCLWWMRAGLGRAIQKESLRGLSAMRAAKGAQVHSLELDDEGMGLGALLADDAPWPDAVLADVDELERVLALIQHGAGLSRLERVTLASRMEGSTLDGAAAALGGYSRERARQLQTSAVAKMRRAARGLR